MWNPITRLLVRGGALAALGVAGIFFGTAVSSSAAGAPEWAKPNVSAPDPARQAAKVPDLGTLPKIYRYLRSIGADPKRFVIQRGSRNYAGPNCPGAAWKCTTSTRVIQLAVNTSDGGGQNRFVCSPKSARVSPTNEATNTCVIVQGPNNSTNSATCDLDDHQADGTLTQTCLATQIGRRNSFFARQRAVMGADNTDQDVFQTISAKQISGTGGNTLETSQGAFLTSGPDSSSTAVLQDAHQITCGSQEASGSGANVARSAQSQVLVARKREATGVDIAQNTDVSVLAECPGPATFTASPGDCAVPLFVPALSLAKEHANACTRIHQDSGSGRNTISLGQLDSLFAEVKNSSGSVGVEQGNATPDETGTDGTLTQDSTGLSQIFFNGLTTQVTNIDGLATGSFFTVDQTDTGPRCCGTGSPNQQTNPSNDFKSDERLIQRVFVNGALAGDVANGVFSQTGQVKGDCETSGTPSAGGCVFNLSGSNNADPGGTSNSCGAGQESSCHVLVTCQAAGGGDLVTIEQVVQSCEPETAPPDVTISVATEPTPTP
jgi:hypothetical protein